MESGYARLRRRTLLAAQVSDPLAAVMEPPSAGFCHYCALSRGRFPKPQDCPYMEVCDHLRKPKRQVYRFSIACSLRAPSLWFSCIGWRS